MGEYVTYNDEPLLVAARDVPWLPGQEGVKVTADQYTYFLHAIRDHSGLELRSIGEAGEHGADAGWAGFTYTSDGADFYRAHQSQIVELMSDDADDYGYETLAAFVASFARADMTDAVDGYECLCAWYVLEEVGRFYNDRRYEATHDR